MAAELELQELSQAKATAIDLAVRFGPRLLVAVLLLAAGFVVGRWLGQAAARTLARFEVERTVTTLVCRIVRVLVLVLFAALALQNLGVELLPLIAGLGIAGAGVALALQGVLGNLAAGLTIVFTRPFRIGEYVEIVGVEGKVEEISLFSTTLGHPNRSRGGARAARDAARGIPCAQHRDPVPDARRPAAAGDGAAARGHLSGRPSAVSRAAPPRAPPPSRPRAPSDPADPARGPCPARARRSCARPPSASRP
jgi:hypothetical protein